MIYWLLFLSVAVFSFFGTAALRKYALTGALLDIPTSRSSHTVITPRGGGVAIVIAFLLALPVLDLAGSESVDQLLSVGVAGCLVAVIGFIDDHGHIAARWRLSGHFIAAFSAIFWLNGLPEITIFGAAINFGWLGHILAAIYLVWMLNLYNFMDGIDGIAGVEAICVCLGGALLYWLSGANALIWLPLILAVAVAGFLCWNFPPARIFMGDAGSGFIGIVLGVMSLQAAWVSSQLFWGWLILMGVFIVDATFTLIRRMLRGDKVYEAHRSHAYQFASRQFGGHLPVTLTVGVLNVLWLLPIALCVILGGLDGAVGLIVAYLPLVILAFKYRAGEVEKNSHATRPSRS